MPVRKLTEKEELLESDRICSIAFAGSWSREEAIKALEAPSSPPPVSFGYFNQEGALTASMVLPEYQARYQGGSRSHNRRGRRSLSARAPI